MDIGVVLPSGIPGVDGRVVVEWARRADAGPFSSVAVPDRLRYDNLDLMMTLAAAAAVTRRVRIMSNVLLTPLRPSPWLAKQVGTLTALAPDRVTLGVGVGARRQDYETAGVPWQRRGALLDEQLAALTSRPAHDDEQLVGPAPRGAVEILIGGASQRALDRLVAHGDGYVAGGIRPEFFSAEAAASVAAWRRAGRSGRPRLVAGGWFSSSEDLDDDASRWLASYFRQGGPPGFVNSGICRGTAGVTEQIRRFRAAGADEVILFPCTADLAELDWLAELVSGLADMPVGEPAFPAAGPPFDPHAVVPGTAGVRVYGAAEGPPADSR
ncbi:LLM class flavin-dependent oxidoreductase [Dactylosporangium siamense]|uniref:Luciferase n=1 Tax=Dactylosporangium siamense TaxID=685454 RepID=A0A919U9F5_9ACTN|nr:LLM class flavin-dependent oxidoreductase [Dactylosporangium siamense]GIG42598.1 luciferase [Dactylosporangium siamense]